MDMGNKFLVAVVFAVLTAGFLWLISLVADTFDLQADGVSEDDFRLLQLKVTAAAAFAGFLGGTVIKFGLDLLLDYLQGRTARKVMAKELLAELRYVGAEIYRTKNAMDEIDLGRPPAQEAERRLRYSRLYRIAGTPVFDASIGKLGLLGVTTATCSVEVFSELRHLAQLKDPLQDDRAEVRFAEFADFRNEVDRQLAAISPRLAELDRLLAKIADVPAETEDQRWARAVPPKPNKAGVVAVCAEQNGGAA